jgi:hypothetical protein
MRAASIRRELVRKAGRPFRARASFVYRMMSAAMVAGLPVGPAGGEAGPPTGTFAHAPRTMARAHRADVCTPRLTPPMDGP